MGHRIVLNHVFAFALICSFMALSSKPAGALTLDFPTDKVDGETISQGFGDNPSADISYRPIVDAFGDVASGTGSIAHWDSDYGDLKGVAWNTVQGEGAEIRFDAIPSGKIVQIFNLKLAGWTQDEPGDWKIFNTDWELLAEGGGIFPGGDSHADVVLASVYSDTGGIVLQWSRAWWVAVDEINYIVTDAPVSTVPLPGAIYLFLTGLISLAAVGRYRRR